MSSFPRRRMRRLRQTETMRRMVRENSISVDDLIYPLFVVPGKNVRKAIPSLPGCYHYSVDRLVQECRMIRELGIPGILLFGIPEKKDACGSGAYAPDGIIQQACGEIASQVNGKDAPDQRLEIITDVCLCEYTNHGHCGPLNEQGEVDNDGALDLLAQTAVSHARAGATMLAPSDMMDGRIGRIRMALDNAKLSNVPIMSYAAKYASGFYGPFRDAAQSSPQSGHRHGYQMDPANSRQALEEVRLDIEEGADIIMVKPGLPYLDIVRQIRDRWQIPLAAYHVSGEYAMTKAAAEKHLIDETHVVMESMLAFKRAGADLIITYYAREIAEWLA